MSDNLASIFHLPSVGGWFRVQSRPLLQLEEEFKRIWRSGQGRDRLSFYGIGTVIDGKWVEGEKLILRDWMFYYYDLPDPYPRYFFLSPSERKKGKVPYQEVDILAYHPERIELSFPPGDRSRFLVGTETFHPGWRAYWKGKRVEIERYQDLFRSVKIPPSGGKLVFVFLPLSFLVGVVISGAGVVWVLRFLSRRSNS